MALIPDMTFETIVEKTKKMLGDNYREPEQKDVSLEDLDTMTEVNESGDLVIKEETTDLEDICAMVIREAAQWTNRYTDTGDNTDMLVSVMNDCWPVIVKCSCMAYLNRGSEGLGSQSELGQQNVYADWVTFMHKQLTNRRYVV